MISIGRPSLSLSLYKNLLSSNAPHHTTFFFFFLQNHIFTMLLPRSVDVAVFKSTPVKKNNKKNSKIK